MIKTSKPLLLGLVALALLLADAKAAHAGAPTKAGLTIRSLPGVSIEPPRRMRAKGYPWDHEIQIALPPSYSEGKSSYPVLWVTDGSYWFDTAVQMVNLYDRNYLGEMIVVGIGVPPEALSEYQKRRTYDFSPNDVVGFEGLGGDLAKPQPGDPVFKGGGAAAFLAFLVEVVRPALAHDYRMSNENLLFGDSGGGIFCAYALLTRPEAFNKYICGSPALYLGNFELFRLEESYHRAHRDLAAEVFFGAGEGEITQPGVAAVGIVSSMSRMAEILTSRSYPSLRLHVHLFPDEEHSSVIPDNLSWGLRAVMPRPPK